MNCLTLLGFCLTKSTHLVAFPCKIIINAIVPDNKTEYECPDDEARVPLLVVGDGDDAEEEEDDAVGEGGQRLDAVLDRRVRLGPHVGEGVPLLHDAAADEADDARPVDALGQHVGQVAGREDDQRLDHPG